MSASTIFNQKIRDLGDSEQIAAINCNTNCVVTAGAGSGKTMVLSYRFIRLIVEKRCHVDEILTLTFTRLAAAEMYTRIQKELHNLTDDEDIEEELKLFTKATITTIDAFCHRIVASDPTRYGLPADFVLDEEESRVMAKECALALFREEPNHPGLVALATYASPDSLMDQLLVPLAIKHFHPSSSSFNKEKMEVLVIDQFISHYQECVEGFLGVVNALLKIVHTTPLYFKNLPILQEIASKGGELSDPAKFGNLSSYYTSLKVEKLKGGDEGTRIEYNALVDIFRRYNQALLLAESALANRKMLTDTYSFLEHYYYRYLKAKRERGVVNHGDIAAMALDILINNATVRRYWQGRFRYILVDEFQDTNRLQKDLVYLLAAKSDFEGEGVPPPNALVSDKLFFVGDEKQSIYRFRNADVRVFKRLGKEIVASGGQKILLKHNYRSEPALVSFYNVLFEKIMGESTAEYEAQFKELEMRGATPGLTPKIEFHFKELPKDDQPIIEEEGELATAVEAEAYAIQELIKKMVASDAYLIRGQEGVRRPEHKDIAILLRTVSNQLYYEKALRAVGIPYTLSAVQSLFLEAPANDLYNFLQLLVFPDDKLAYTALLRSPFCYLSDDTIFLLLDKWDGVPFAHSPTSDTEIAKFLAAKELFERLQELAKTATITDLITLLWYEGGYRNHLLRDSSYQVYLEHFDYLFELALTYDRRREGLSEFLDFLRPLLGEKERLDEIEPLKAIEEGVKILTIHKSKGLEFPIVIVANMGTIPRAPEKPGWHEMEVDDELLIIPNHMPPVDKKRNLLYELYQEEEGRMESAEMKRLFYVALTRAESHLCLFGCQNRSNLGEKGVDSNFLALFKETLDSLGKVDNLEKYPIGDIKTDELKSSVSQADLKKRVTKMGKLYQEVKENKAPHRLTYSVSEYTKGEREGEGILLPQLEIDSLLEKYSIAAPFGTWSHALIQATIERGVESLSGEECLELIPKEIARLRLSAPNLATLSGAAYTLAEGFLQSELYGELKRGNPLSFESEVPFAYRAEEGVVVNGVIDLLVRYSDEIKIVDFKTDAYLFKDLHQGQLRLYREAMERLYHLPTSSAVVYLRDCSQSEWVS
jgi:ATP-dependent exoDNAse (exonuclease V) beta subunit